MLGLPEWLDLKLWTGWLEVREEMRKRKGIPFTDHAKELALEDLVEWHTGGYDTGYVLKEAIKNGWRGLFINERTPKRKLAAQSTSPERATEILQQIERQRSRPH